MSSETLNLTPELYHYFQSVTLREHPILEALRKETKELSTSYNMQISPEQGQFMMFLIELLDAKKTLDIGTFTGYSALVAALALPEKGLVITCDIDEISTKIAKRFWNEASVSHKIELRLGKALEILQSLQQDEAETFDFAFIDADKANSLTYYESCLILLRKGGVVAIDNVLWGGKVADKKVNDKSTVAIRELNDFIHKDPRVTISMLPIGDGLTLARKH